MFKRLFNREPKEKPKNLTIEEIQDVARVEAYEKALKKYNRQIEQADETADELIQKLFQGKFETIDSNCVRVTATCAYDIQPIHKNQLMNRLYDAGFMDMDLAHQGAFTKSFYVYLHTKSPDHERYDPYEKPEPPQPPNKNIVPPAVKW